MKTSFIHSRCLTETLQHESLASCVAVMYDAWQTWVGNATFAVADFADCTNTPVSIYCSIAWQRATLCLRAAF